MFLRHIVAAAWVEHVDHRIVAREQPQPPLMADFTSLFHENSPSRFVGVKESGLDVMPSKGFVNRSQQRFDSLESIRDRAGGQSQSQESQLLNAALSWTLKLKLFDQQIHPDTGAITTFGDELRRHWRGDRARRFDAVAGAPIAFAFELLSIQFNFNFDLLTVFGTAKIGQRQTAAAADFFFVRQVDDFDANGQVRMVSSFRSRTIGLLTALLSLRAWLFRVNGILRIDEIVRAIDLLLFFR